MRVRWAPGPFAIRCAKEIGLEMDFQVAQEVYERFLFGSYSEFLHLNTLRDPALVRNWWRDLTSRWMQQMKVAQEFVDPLLDRADQILYDPQEDIFEVFVDVEPVLQSLARSGMPLIVISNWDESLSRILNSRNLLHYFVFALASLEEGVEKPDARLFEIAIERLGIPANEILHVGDSAVDDLQGAQNAGMQARLVDRSAATSGPLVLTSLAEVLPLVL